MNTKDYLHNVTKWIDHNRGQFFGSAIPVALLVVMLGVFGCSKTQSLNDPAVKVDRATFAFECLSKEQTLGEQTVDIQAELKKHNAKIATYNQRREAGYDDLKRQDEIKQQVAEIASGAVAQYASGGTVSMAPLIMSAFNLAGIGWGIGNKFDNTRKDKIISERKAKT